MVLLTSTKSSLRLRVSAVQFFKVFNRLVDAFRNPYKEQPEYADLEQAPEAVEIVHQTFCGT